MMTQRYNCVVGINILWYILIKYALTALLNNSLWIWMKSHGSWSVFVCRERISGFFLQRHPGIRSHFTSLAAQAGAHRATFWTTSCPEERAAICRLRPCLCLWPRSFEDQLTWAKMPSALETRLIPGGLEFQDCPQHLLSLLPKAEQANAAEVWEGERERETNTYPLIRSTSK